MAKWLILLFETSMLKKTALLTHLYFSLHLFGQSQWLPAEAIPKGASDTVKFDKSIRK